MRGTIKPSLDSDIRFELWLPEPAAWNGKYEGVGNGGFAGFITYTPMGRALEAGYAVSGTDTGHVAQGTDARWALSHPEKVIDFGWRAIHETAVASKAIVQAYYGQGPAHAYFAGCSDGGREALMEAQRFPRTTTASSRRRQPTTGPTCWPPVPGPSRLCSRNRAVR